MVQIQREFRLFKSRHLVEGKPSRQLFERQKTATEVQSPILSPPGEPGHIVRSLDAGPMPVMAKEEGQQQEPAPIVLGVTNFVDGSPLIPEALLQIERAAVASAESPKAPEPEPEP